MNELAELLIKNNISIGTVESFTVGNFCDNARKYSWHF